MKFMTWNVNGIRALTQYHPYCDDLHKNYKEILDYLGADVICLQETKITRSKLEADLALVPGYDSYWSFHRTKSGYSGVAVYIKDHIKLLAAEEGISGVLSGNIAMSTTATQHSISRTGASPGKAVLESNSTSRRIGGYPSLDAGDDAGTHARYQELDTEGRGLVLDFGFFVLFNLYCPNETDDTRLPFKMDYYHVLEARVQELINSGKQVIVLGDMNVIPTELDHCDPEKWKKEAGEVDFTNTLPRRWFNSFLAPSGPMTDLYRVFHKDEPGAFTCWNTKINARPSNYGTRLDYILVTSELLPWFKSCERKPHVVGSDHCPVVAEMFAELAVEKTQKEQSLDRQEARKLQEILDSYGGTTEHSLAAKFFDEFSGKQQKLSAFFKKPSDAAGNTGPSRSVSITSSQSDYEPKRPASRETSYDEAPRKKAFFSSDKSNRNIQPSLSASTPTTPTSAPEASPIKSSPGSSTIPNKPTKPNTKPMVKASPSRTTQDKSSSRKQSETKPLGQQSMLSFFSSPSKKQPQDIVKPEIVVLSNSQSVDQNMTAHSQQSSMLSALSQPQEAGRSSQSSSSSSVNGTVPWSSSVTFSPDDFADWIPGSQEVMPFSTNGEMTTSKWQSLFQPKAIPKCRLHGVPCTEYTVNKKGPNKGRRFFLCSLPVGPEGDAIGQKPEYRCNYFEWLNPERKK